jgi:hypothetical protein
VFTRLTVTVAVLLLIGPVAAAITNPTWAAAVGLDVWNVPALREEAEGAAELDRDLDTECVEVRRRIEVKEDLVRGLIDGRTTLAETTTQFIAIDRDRPEYLNNIRRSQLGATDEEKVARNVVEYVIPRVRDVAAWHRLLVLARLNVEFHVLYTTEVPELTTD